ncbi:MAG: ureidoglycolate lyase [Deltaproteobacteria bacterium]
MSKLCLPVRRISSRAFMPFGRVIGYPNRGRAQRRRNLFHVVLRQPGKGWRIAYLVVRDRAIDRLEQHPQSYESFEPVRGRCLLFVARRRAAVSIRCFLLDRPVILRKGLWHGIVTLGREADVKITENDRVRCEYWDLGRVLGSPKRDRGAGPQ